jgi:hypothetical protein
MFLLIRPSQNVKSLVLGKLLFISSHLGSAMSTLMYSFVVPVLSVTVT